MPLVPFDVGYCDEYDELTTYSDSFRRWLQLRFEFDSTAIRPPFDSHSTAIRPRYDHSTTCVTTVGLSVCVGCCIAA